jgi:predicted transcriptional regulator
MPHFKIEHKRHKAEMWRDLLQALKDGVFLVTPLMHRSNLNHHEVYEILNVMVARGLVVVEHNGTRGVWSITPKGHEALKTLTEVFALVRNVTR